MSLVDKVIEWLKNANQEQRNTFMEQFKNEKDLFEELRKAGLSPTVTDPQSRASQKPNELLSKQTKIDLIDLITEISHITAIDVITSIGNIDNIKVIRNAVFTENYCRNGSFETGTTEEWTWILGTHTIDNAVFYDGLYSLKSTPCILAVWQNIIPCYGDEVLISYFARTDIAQNFTLLIEYSDGDSETSTIILAIGDWTFGAFAPTKHKIIQNVTFYGTNATAGKSFWLDRVQVIKHNLTRISSLPAITGALTQRDRKSVV